MYNNKKIKVYKETDKKEKLWDELGKELGWQVGTNLICIYYNLFLVSLSRAIVLNKVLKVIFHMYCACVFGAMHLFFNMICVFVDICWIVMSFG